MGVAEVRVLTTTRCKHPIVVPFVTMWLLGGLTGIIAVGPALGGEAAAKSDAPAPRGSTGTLRLELRKLAGPGSVWVRCYTGAELRAGYDGGCFGSADVAGDTKDCKAKECVMEKQFPPGPLRVCCDLWLWKERWRGYHNEMEPVIETIDIVPGEARVVNMECATYSGFTAKRSYLRTVSK